MKSKISRDGKTKSVMDIRWSVLPVLFAAGVCILGPAEILSHGAEEKEYAAPRIVCSGGEETNGWYHSEPEVTIVHSEPDAFARYKIVSASGRITEGKLETEKENEEEEDREEGEKGEESTGREDGEENIERPEGEDIGESAESTEEEDREEGAESTEKEPENPSVIPVSAELPKDVWEEGENVLTVWLEFPDESKGYFQKKTISLDKSVPEQVKITYPIKRESKKSGGGTLYFQDEVNLQLESHDQISGVKEIVCIMEDGTQKRLKGEKVTLTLPLGYKGKVSAYAVDYAGNESEKSTSEVIMIEDEAPEIILGAQGGFGVWYQNSVEISASIRECGELYGYSSGLSSVSCYVDGKCVLRKDYEAGKDVCLTEHIVFTADQVSEGGKPVTVMVRAVDIAGNSAISSEKLFIDRAAPELKITGLYDTMITGGKIEAIFTASDENVLKECHLSVWYTDTEQKKKKLTAYEAVNWINTDGGRQAETVFTEEGAYECTVLAEDMAGHKTERTLSFIIDHTSPVIRYVDQMDKSYIPYFQWNYEKEEMIQDFTDYTYIMYLNGGAYFSGTRITEEGVYFLEVKARDAAGNEASAEAKFTIDHTPPRIQWGELQTGSSYEESVLLTVWVDGEGEYLDKLTVNGEEQKLSAQSRIFQYEINECGPYIVEAEAYDRAGNRSEEQMVFEVTEKEGIVTKLIQPVSRILTGDGKTGGGIGIKEGTDENEEDKNYPYTVLILCIIAGGTAICAYAGRKKRKRQNRKR